jgi:hypothetical protein
MSCNRPTCQSDLGKLAEEAERLQTLVNEFIGRATMADVELPMRRLIQPSGASGTKHSSSGWRSMWAR